MRAPLVIIGTGLAGYNLAKEWRKWDQETPLVLLTQEAGHFYSKPMLSTALAQQKIPEQLPIASVDEMRSQLQARIETHTVVTRIIPEEQAVFFAGERLSYQHLVLALGASPIRPLWQGDGVPEVLSVNDLSDYQSFRLQLTEARHIGVIGSGLVGCEFTNDLLLNGYQVSVITLEKSPLASLIPPVAGAVVEQALSEKGAHWYFEEQVQAIHKEKEGYTIACASGKRIQCDLVLSACGLKPKTTLAKEAGIAVQEGIVVSRYLQTNMPKLYALGDCAQIEDLVLQYVSPLMHGVRALAKTLSGIPTQVHYPPLPVSVKTTICPVLVCIHPREFVTARWEVEQKEGLSLKATAWDKEQNRIGFVVTGSFLKERHTLTEGLAPFLNIIDEGI